MTCRAGHSFLSADAFCHPMLSCHSEATHSVIPSNTLCHSERHTLSFRSEARNLERKNGAETQGAASDPSLRSG